MVKREPCSVKQYVNHWQTVPAVANQSKLKYVIKYIIQTENI